MVASQETNTVQLLPLKRVESICASFEESWCRDSPPDIADYLHKVSEQDRATLLRNVLHIDLRYRRRAGEEPGEEDYTSRFPQYADVITEEFQQSTQEMLSVAVDTVSFSPRSRQLEMPTVVRLGDYVLERELGRGAMGIVFAARHLRHGTLVALKTLPTVGGPELHRFKREFRSLADLNHPNLVGLHTLQADGGQWFFTMDLVEGEDFQSYVRPDDELDMARLRDALAQLAGVVHALHCNQIVHRDLKPSNIMVSQDGRVRVLDFGLVLNLTPRASDRADAEIGGTPAYMAPEQIRLETTSTASDWYAVGSMLYEALSGRVPFRGSMMEVLRAKQSSDPPPLPDSVPDDLAQLCCELLRREAADRPATEEILRVACPDTVAPVGLDTPSSVRLIGREQAIDQIGGAVRSFEQGDGAAAILIRGKSGEGKTVLAEHFLDRFRRDAGYTIFAGRCYDRESLPFKALDTLIDALCSHLNTVSSRELSELLTPDVAVLSELFPVFNRIDAVARLPRVRLDHLEMDQVRGMAADALRAMLGRLAQKTNLVWFIDDLQWGDAESAELLLQVLSGPEAPRLLLLGTFRSDEMASSRFLVAWTTGRQNLGSGFPQTDSVIEPLSAELCVRLVVDIVGSDTPAVRRRAREMAEETGGNPFLLSELASCYDPDADVLQPMQMEEVLDRKLTLLPEDARALLDVVCVSGQSLALDEAAHTVGHSSVPLSTITRMRTERLLRLVGSDDDPSVDTYHDRIRETVLRNMEPATHKGLHVGLAEEIEASAAESAFRDSPTVGDSSNGEPAVHPRVYDLAYHFYEGSDPRAFGYQLQAGEAAIRAYALDNALEHLKKAEQTMPADAEPGLCYRLWERLGEVCGRTRRLQEALQYYEKAEAVAGGATQRAVSKQGIGEMQHLMGQFAPAVEWFDKALGELGYRRPNWLPHVLAEASCLMTLCQFMWLVRPYKTEAKRRQAELASEIVHRIGQILMMQGDMGRYVDVSVRQAYLGLRSGRTDALAFGFGKLGFNHAVASFETPAKWLLARAVRFNEQSHDMQMRGSTEGFLGAAYFCFGDLDGAERRLRAALEIHDRMGDSWLRTIWHHNLRHVYEFRGHSHAELAEAQIEHEIGEAIRDPEAICWGQYGMASAKARMGRLDEAYAHIGHALAVIANRDSALTQTVAHHHHGFVLMQGSEFAKAIERLSKSCRILESKFMYIEHAIHAYPLLFESLVGPNWLDSSNNADLRRARQVSRRARFFAWRFPNIAPHTLRIQGRLLCTLGRRKRGIRYFQKSIEHARRQGTDYALARSLLDMAAVDEANACAFRAEAIALLRRLDAVIPHAEGWLLGKGEHESLLAPQMPSTT